VKPTVRISEETLQAVHAYDRAVCALESAMKSGLTNEVMEACFAAVLARTRLDSLIEAEAA
jgi:hypothetical protein